MLSAEGQEAVNRFRTFFVAALRFSFERFEGLKDNVLGVPEGPGLEALVDKPFDLGSGDLYSQGAASASIISGLSICRYRLRLPKSYRGFPNVDNDDNALGLRRRALESEG